MRTSADLLLWLLHDALVLAGGLYLGARLRLRRLLVPRRCRSCGRFGGGRAHVCRSRRSDH